MAATYWPEGWPVPSAQSRELGLVVRVEFDSHGDMFAVYKDGTLIERGVQSLDPWLAKYEKEHT